MVAMTTNCIWALVLKKIGKVVMFKVDFRRIRGRKMITYKNKKV